MSPTPIAIAVSAATLLSLAAVSQGAAITAYASALPTETFDALASTGSTGTTLPAGWTFTESGTNADTTYGVDNGGSNSGNTYSYGTTGSTDRAFGGLRSSSLIPVIGASFTNSVTDGTLTSLAISYRGEQWRLGSANADRLDFQYSTNATSLTTGTWTDVDGLDFNAPVTTGSARSLDGNATGNFAAVAGSITGLNVASGGTIWIRFTDFDATSSDSGLAIDNFNLTAAGVVVAAPEPASLAALLGLTGVIARRRR